MSGPLGGRRVVLVNWRDPWHRLAGGSERYAWELALGLLGAGAAVEFWTARDTGQAATEVREGIRLRRAGGPYGFYVGVWRRLLADRLRGRAPDAVVDVDCGIPGFTPPLLGRRTGVLLVVHHVHQEQFRTAMPRPVSDLGRFLERRVMPRVYRDVPTVAVSESTVVEMREQLGWRAPVTVIRNGTDLPPGPVTAAGAAERVVVLGRQVAHKRVDRVLRALAEVVAHRPALRVDLVGTGPEHERLVALVRELGLGDVVRVHGFVSEAHKSAVLAGARLHVAASDAEGWGLTVLEAAAHGVPTLARDVPGLRDSVRHGETGWLLGPRERIAAALDVRLDELADGAVRTRVARACRAWAEAHGWSAMRAAAVAAVDAVLTDEASS